MALPGAGFIALWNDIAAVRGDYDSWHTTEHVPQRLGVEGILRAYRYVRSAGELPRYLTLYALADLAVLNSDAYRSLVREPTSWTESMRPDFRNFLRVVCRTTATTGEGVGGYAAVRTTRTFGRPQARLISMELLAMDGVSAVHVGDIDFDAKGLDLDLDSAPAVKDATGVLVVEGYDATKLRGSCESVDLEAFATPSSPFSGWTFYDLAFELRKEDLSPKGGVARRTLRESGAAQTFGGEPQGARAAPPAAAR